jgi:hypothetical protein
MRATMVQAGQQLIVETELHWLQEVLAEACGDALIEWHGEEPDVHLVVPAERAAFDVQGWEPLTRGAWCRHGEVVLQNACGSGFDLRVRVLASDVVHVEARFRPPLRERVASRVLRSRFHLLTRAALLQYPAMWAAGRDGAAPLHAAAVTVDGSVVLLAGPGGVGRSTLLLGALSTGERACSDNLCVSDGTTIFGVVEPVRIEGAGGRHMPHGRGECALPARVDKLQADQVVVLRRAASGPADIDVISSDRAAEVLVAGTYMAGELRRYWPFAATLALGTGFGPVHPPVQEVALTLTRRLPARAITLGTPPAPALADLLAPVAATRELAS